MARKLAIALLVLLCIYSMAAVMRYRFLHPNLTETQLLLRLPDIYLWR
jgi:hypothetical protein